MSILRHSQTMNIYQGINRRQVGGGIWSTIARGIRPILLNLFKTLRPHAASAAKRVAHSAAKIGTEMTTDALAGQFNKDRLKQSLQREGGELKHDALTTLKRKLEGMQSGSGNKRRRINAPRQTNMKRRVVKKTRRLTKKVARKRTVRRKRASKVNKRTKSRGIQKRRNRRRSRKGIKDIFNL
jgi:hypothetical protein